ncbi:hypothetical protein CN692_16970 [Bacillus sp. AFS002410]|uniref:hypothetical protein n=1 Tax=Bacillus sp. AFS002410 TaxID=2033481 RepID=UPI000BF10672|nr:hypothetical protein [Bacillus sp. AFS002410]PEJ56532.1 hypothetical protein CN692_16970 [Bacillus sp. AFS002410]
MKKVFICSLIFIVVLISLSIYSMNSQNLNLNTKNNSSNAIKELEREDNDTELKKTNSTSNQTNNPRKEVIKTSGLLFGHFDSVEDLTKDSDLVVQGTVIAAEPYVYKDPNTHGTPYTKLTYKIRNVLSGDKKMIGKTITILEYGGEISKKDFGLDQKFKNISKEELEEKLVILFEGIPNSKVGQNIVAFLSNDMGNMDIGFKFYSFRGAYKGRFTQDNNTGKYIRGIPNNLTLEMKEIELKINNEVTELTNQLEG